MLALIKFSWAKIDCCAIGFSISTHLCCCCHSYQKSVFFFLFRFLDLRDTSMITVRCGHRKYKGKSKHFNCKLACTKGLTKVKINFQTWSNKFRPKCWLKLGLDEFAQIVIPFQVWAPRFSNKWRKNCWTSWCQYARLLIKRTIILL